MGKKKKEKRKKNKDVQQLNEEFSSELTRGRNSEEPKDMAKKNDMRDSKDTKDRKDMKDSKNPRRGNC